MTVSTDFTAWTGIGYVGEFLPESLQNDFALRFKVYLLPRLNRHCPWVIKDPRLCLTSHLLLPYVYCFDTQCHGYSTCVTE